MSCKEQSQVGHKTVAHFYDCVFVIEVQFYSLILVQLLQRCFGLHA